MRIQVLGSGCGTCKKLYELTKKAVEELGINTKVEYITDIQKIVEMGVMSSPVLAINGKPVMTGATSDLKKIKKRISQSETTDQAEMKKNLGCTCGGNCK